MKCRSRAWTGAGCQRLAGLGRQWLRVDHGVARDLANVDDSINTIRQGKTLSDQVSHDCPAVNDLGHKSC